MLDADYNAMPILGFPNLPFTVGETGWPTAGGHAATIPNAELFNKHLIQHVDSKGTQRPDARTTVFLFKLYDENQKPGPEYERHWDSSTPMVLQHMMSPHSKCLQMAGISVVGRNKYGCFPLRGKLSNFREANHQQVKDNAEISNIKRILGLQQGKDYTDTKSLHYGHLMIMADQDHDGSHIIGLLINFIHSFWPSLLNLQ